MATWDKDDDKKADEKKPAKKGKELWRHKVTQGKAHPDNKPPVTIIGEATEENVKKYEDSINAEREKEFAPAVEEEAEKDNGKKDDDKKK